MNSMDHARQFAVNWSNHMSHIKQALDNLLENNDYTDVTLYVEGKKIGAHKMLLSACSSYFNQLFHDFPQEHPIVVLKGVRCCVIKDILKFIYSGEVSVDSKHFDNFLETAEFLEISGLTTNTTIENQKDIDLSQNKLPRRIKSRKRKDSQVIEEETVFSLDEEWDSNVLNELCDIQFAEIGPESTIYESEHTLIKTEAEEPFNNVQDSVHSSDNLTCPICFKVFTHPYSLHHHKPVHLGRTKCPICSAVLSRKYNLKMHMRAKHNIV